MPTHRLFALLLLLLACPLLARIDPKLQLASGNPTQAAKAPENFLIVCPQYQYALSYNASLGIPNWVSWHVSRGPDPGAGAGPVAA